MLVDCTKCAAPLPEALFKGTAAGTCVNCKSSYEIRAFPAIAAAPSALALSDLALAEGDSSCFQHTSKKAISSCNQCGRFLCALCQMESSGLVWCPTCLVSSISKHKVQGLENQRTLYDSVALGMAALPLLLVSPAIFTGPIALFLSIKYWKRPSSLVPRTKWRLVVALLLGILETGAMIGLILLLIWSFGRGRGRT